MHNPVNRASQPETHLNQVRIINQKLIMIDQRLQRVSRMGTIVVQTDKAVREIHKDKRHKEARADRMTQETHRDKFPEIPLKISPQIKQNNLLKHLSKHCKS